MVLPVLVRGGANQCNKMEWVLNYTIRNISAQREYLLETCMCVDGLSSLLYNIVSSCIALKDYNETNMEGTINVNAARPALMTLLIVDDDVLELDETFQVEISLQNSEDENCIILQPNVVDITIMDNDSET